MEARRIARDAIEGRHEEAVQAEAQAALRRWGIKSKAELITKATEILDRTPDVESILTITTIFICTAL